METIRNLSIRKSIVLYLAASLIISFFLTTFIVYQANRLQQSIWRKYIVEEEYRKLQTDMDQKGYRLVIPRMFSGELTDKENFLVELCDVLQTWTSLILPVAGSVAAVYLFYRNKIKKPLEEMAKGSRMIAENDLGFSIDYKNKDELGVLCGEFEKMRMQLWENNSRMWKMIEQEKALRAAVAHDIRSPLTIMKGYQEMLIDFIPEGQLEPEKVMEILEGGMGQIDRMNDFVETMRQLSSLEERKLQCLDFMCGELMEEIRLAAQAMGRKEGKSWEVTGPEKNSSGKGDRGMILEVAENLIANAMRYAASHVCIQVEIREGTLLITIRDNGGGFREEAEVLTRAYYHSNPQGDLNHWGLGLYICRLYCELHGGKLLLSNSADGGACAKASFKIIGNA